MLMLRFANVSDAAVKTATARTPAARAVESTRVRREAQVRHARVAFDPRHHLFGVRQLRDRVRTHERRRFDDGESARRQHVDEAHFVAGRHDLALVLQPVARPHLANFDAVGHSRK